MDCKAVFNATVAILSAYRDTPVSRRTETPQEYVITQLTNASSIKKQSVVPGPRRSWTAEDMTFIAEVCVGVERYWGACEGLYAAYTKGLKRTDQEPIQFAVVSYLYIYRASEMEASTIAALVSNAAVAFRVAEFTVFATTLATLECFAEPQWLNYFQNEYITDFLIPSLIQVGPSLRAAVCPGVVVDFSRNLAGAGGGALAASSVTPAMNHRDRLTVDDSSDDDDDHSPPDDMPMLSAQYDDDEFVETVLSKSAKSNSTVANTPTTAPPLTTTNKTATNRGAPSSSTTKQKHNTAAVGSAVIRRPQQGGKLPPKEVREMIATVAPPRPAVKVCNATEAERNAVEAAKYGVKLSTLDPDRRDANREREAALPFVSFVPTSRPSAMPRLQLEQQEREEFQKVSCPSVEEVRRKLADVSEKVDYRTTAATVRREELLVRKQREQEVAKLAQQESNLHDDRAYQIWRQKEEDDAERDRQLLIKERKLEAMLSDAEARRSKIKQQEGNRKEVEKLKIKAEVVSQVQAKEHQKETRRLRRQAVEQRETIALQVQEAKKKDQDKRVGVAVAVKQEKREINLQIALESELERERKAHMIAEIKKAQKEAAQLRHEAMLEKQRENREGIIGESELGNLGASAYTMLHKLTVAELRVVQGRLQEENAQLVEEKRIRIVSQRQAEKETVQAMERDVVQRREQVRAEKENQRRMKKEREERIREEQRSSEEKKLFELQRHLEDKRVHKKTLETKYRDEDKRRAIASHLLEADGNAVERKKIADLERALGNTVVANQNAALQARKVHRAISASEAQRRDTNINHTRNKLNSARQLSDKIAQDNRDALNEERRTDLLMQRKVLESMKQERANRKR